MWRRRRRDRGPSPETAAAAEKLVEALKDCAKAKRDDETVAEVSEAQERLLRRNHLGPMITRALRGAR